MLRTLPTAARLAASVSLGALATLHMLWAAGSAWPAPDRATLADAVGGFAEVPGSGACLAVATALASAAIATSGTIRSLGRISRLGSAFTACAFFVRGGLGLAGAMPQARRSAAFARLDRRVYSPICIVVATLAAVAAMPSGNER